jgi:hypothetical protein
MIVNPLLKDIFPPTLLSAAAVTPVTNTSFISGTTQIATINPLSGDAHQLTFIFTDASPGTFLTTGNIALGVTPIRNAAVILSYEPRTKIYYPISISGGVGGSSMPIYQTTVVLTDDEIKALPTTPTVVVSASGPGKINFLLQGYLVPSFNVVYTNISTGSTGQALLGFVWGNELSFNVCSNYLVNQAPGQPVLISQLTEFLTSTNGNPTYNNIGVFVPFTGSAEGDNGNWVYPFGSGYRELATNADLAIGAYNPEGDYTGGDPTNTLIATAMYMIYDLTTSQFV